MSSPEFYRERAGIFSALAAAANNEPMARLYAAMAADYLAKADGQQPSLHSVPSIMIIPAALAARRK